VEKNLTPVNLSPIGEIPESHLRELTNLEPEQQREGWRALGYDSWRACMVAEFEQGKSQLHRILDAAQVEKNLLSPIGDIPETHLREIASLEPEQQRKVYKEAVKTAPLLLLFLGLAGDHLLGRQRRDWFFSEVVLCSFFCGSFLFRRHETQRTPRRRNVQHQ
jgi:hypothetical protein